VREICTPGSEWGDGYKVPCRLGEATDSKGQQWQGSAKAKAPRPIPTSRHELREKAYGRYSIPQEEEFADDKRPDLRFHGANFDGPVPVELKLADNWTGPSLFERLENQLCGDYLRDNRSNRGIFALVYRGEKIAWDVPDSDNRVDFPGLIAALQDHWSRISAKYPNIDDVTVIGIDLTKRLK
jgi:hypothetical protein